jgi:hypothetical protein
LIRRLALSVVLAFLGERNVFAIVPFGRRRRDKMFYDKYLANDTTFPENFLTGLFWAVRVEGSVLI